jgi:hypothetical protein
LRSATRDLLVVDSALVAGVHAQGEGRTLIGSDNTSREFSAFDTALAFVGAAVWNYDLVNLATAAFAELYDGYLERFQTPVLEAIVGRPVSLGHIDCYNEPITVMGVSSQHWLRTSCVFLPPAEIRLLPSLRAVRDRSQWFSGVPEAPFRPEAPISSNYRKQIIDWLQGADIGQGVRWHSRLTLDQSGLNAFEHKAEAILNEHLFTLRLREAGCRSIDVTWLSGVVERGEYVDWGTPWWEQIAHRDRGALHVVSVPDEARGLHA